MNKIEEAIKSGNLIGPIVVEPRRDTMPKEFKAVGNFYLATLARDPLGDSHVVKRALRRVFHRLLDQAIEEACRRGVNRG